MNKLLLNRLAFLILAVIVFTSCQEDEIDSIFFRTDGGISTVIKDAEGQAIIDAKVSLYNFRTENRMDVGYSDDNGVVDFGRFEAGEYSIFTEFDHNDEYFQINEEIHIISGTDTQHEINVADHYGELLVRTFDNSTGQPIEFNPDLQIGLIPTNEAYREVTTSEALRELVKYSFDFEAELSLSDIPESSYLVVLYNEETIINSSFAEVDPFDKDYVNFSVNATSLLLMSKSSWAVTNVTADGSTQNLIPISSISFLRNENMEVTYDNGETRNSYYYLSSGGGFDWYNMGSENYNLSFNEDYYEINSDGSITFYFSYWDTYDFSEGTWYSSNNVSITLD
jgi:hypothetical protein